MRKTFKLTAAIFAAMLCMFSFTACADNGGDDTTGTDDGNTPTVPVSYEPQKPRIDGSTLAEVSEEDYREIFVRLCTEMNESKNVHFDYYAKSSYFYKENGTEIDVDGTEYKNVYTREQNTYVYSATFDGDFTDPDDTAANSDIKFYLNNIYSDNVPQTQDFDKSRLHSGFVNNCGKWTTGVIDGKQVYRISDGTTNNAVNFLNMSTFALGFAEEDYKEPINPYIYNENGKEGVLGILEHHNVFDELFDFAFDDDWNWYYYLMDNYPLNEYVNKCLREYYDDGSWSGSFEDFYENAERVFKLKHSGSRYLIEMTQEFIDNRYSSYNESYSQEWFFYIDTSASVKAGDIQEKDIAADSAKDILYLDCDFDKVGDELAAGEDLHFKISGGADLSAFGFETIHGVGLSCAFDSGGGLEGRYYISPVVADGEYIIPYFEFEKFKERYSSIDYFYVYLDYYIDTEDDEVHLNYRHYVKDFCVSIIRVPLT